MALAAICPDCQGCGHVSFDHFGHPHPQLTWTSNSTADPDWLRCRKCAGSGMVASIPNSSFGNGMSVAEYLHTRFGPDA